MYSQINKSRLFVAFIIFSFCLVLLFIKLFYLQVIQFKKFSKIAQEQHNVLIDLEPRRGTIYDRNMRKLAFNISVDSVYSNSREVKNKKEVADKLSQILLIDKNLLLEKLNKDKAFVWISRKISDEASKKIKAEKFKGIELIKESKRCYPNKEMASQLIGFAGLDNKGLEGLESYLDNYLRGKDGYKVSFRDAKGREVMNDGTKVLLPVNGLNVVLTIDEIIQNITETALKKQFVKSRANGAMAIVMDPHTGEILAIANEPTYDLNKFKTSIPETRRNRCITDFYEPGSVFKIVTASALMEKKAIRLNDMINCENGEYRIAGHILHDAHPHGILTFKEVIEVSSNIGTVKAASRLSQKDMYDFAKAFGFNSLSGVEMPGEVQGILRPVNKWSKTSMTAIPMGQEVTVTALQLVDCISAIANGGTLMKPMILKLIIDEDGEILHKFEPKKIRPVISKETSDIMIDILSGVVEKGTGKKARLSEYTSAGKTGTAQKVDPAGGFSHSKYVGTFVGFAPVNNPRIAISVSIDEPKGAIYYGGDVAAPVFKEIADQVLRYLRVAPDKINEKESVVYKTDIYD